LTHDREFRDPGTVRGVVVPAQERGLRLDPIRRTRGRATWDGWRFDVLELLKGLARSSRILVGAPRNPDRVRAVRGGIRGVLATNSLPAVEFFMGQKGRPGANQTQCPKLAFFARLALRLALGRGAKRPRAYSRARGEYLGGHFFKSKPRIDTLWSGGKIVGPPSLHHAIPHPGLADIGTPSPTIRSPGEMR